MVINGLVPGNTYYFAIRTLDDVPNTSGLSNSPSAAAKSPDAVGAGTYDDAGGSIAYVGTWQTQAGGGPYNSTMHYTNATNAAAYFSFTGTQFTLVFTKISSRGNIEVIIDGGDPILVNQYNATCSGSSSGSVRYWTAVPIPSLSAILVARSTSVLTPSSLRMMPRRSH